jgi:hypothetical protein
MKNTESLFSRRELLGGMVAGSLTLASADLLSAQTRVAKAAGKLDSHPLSTALKIGRAAREKLDDVKDYSAEFYKDEVVGKKRVKQKMLIKVREEPFSVYLRFTSPYAGREVIFVDGSNSGKLLVHGTGIETIVGTLRLSPTGTKAMEESRYPVTMIGMRKLTETLIKQWESETSIDSVAAVKFYPNARIGKVECKVVQTMHPKKGKGIKFHMSRLYIDKKTGFPARVEQFGFPAKSGAQPPMLEQYSYLNVKANAGLKSVDFSESNSKYGY